MKKIFYSFGMLFLCLLFGTSLYAQDAAQYGTPFSGVPDPRDVNIYQVGVGEYSSTRNFQGVINGLDNIKALGINVIYLMPVYPVGASGSPYSIIDFGGVNSAFGSLTDLRNLVDGAHSRGMAVILDWVGYETAIDHPWVTAHPDWYKYDGSGALVKPFPDCAALNTTNTTVINNMIQYMRNWVFTANIDGFRCDYADYSEPSYWTSVISNLRGITTHKLLFLAEGSNEGSTTGCTTCGQNQPGYHYSEGFDFIFGTNFYWNFMKKVYLNGEAATNIDGINTGDYNGASSTQLVARFMTDHDDYGTDGSPFTWMGGKAQVMSAFVIASYMRGVPFIYNGEEVGNTSSLTYPWNTGSINWTQDLTVLSDMKKLLAFRNSSDAIKRGIPTSYTTANVVAFTKTSSSQTAFVAVNVRNSSQTFTLPSGIANTTMYDAFTNTATSLGTSITLSAYQYVAYVNTVVHPTGVTVSPTSASIAGTGTQQLTATVSPSNASNQNVTWSSSNTAVATVNSSGLVTGVAPGTATITVTTVDQGKTATCAITVTSVAVTGVTISPSTATIYTGSTSNKVQLTATISPSNATNKNVTWSSNNTAVATVNSAGLVSSVSAGAATITATTADGAKTATSAITVQAPPQFTVYFYRPSTWGTGINIYWWSALPAGALADGTWPGVSMTNAGSNWYSYIFTNVTSTNLIFNDGTNQTANLSRAGTNGWYLNGTWYDSDPTVHITGVSVSPTSATLTAGGTSQLTATISPSNATNTAITWTSSNTSVATVSSTGLVTAVAAGSATITVTPQDGNKTATSAITVTAPQAGPYGGTPWAIPGTVEAENYNVGGEGVSYHDSDAANQGGQYRNDGVDIETCNAGGYYVGWTNTGEWMNYTVNVSTAGSYNIAVNVASATGSTGFHILFGGINKTGTIAVPNTGGWQTWQTVTVSNVTLSAGTQVMQVYMDGGNFNINNVVLTQAGAVTYYQIVNRWQSGTYLKDGGAGKVTYGTNPSSTDYTYQWQQVSAGDGSGYVYIKNRSTGNYMHIQDLNGSVECGAITLGWWSAEWLPASTGDSWNYLQNRWQTGDWIHVENLMGYAQYASPQTGWYSAEWQFVNGTTKSAPADVNDAPKTSFVVYPNPVTDGNVHIRLDNQSQDAILSIYDLEGRKVQSENLKEDDNSVDISALSGGIYIMKVNSSNGVFTQKLIVK